MAKAARRFKEQVGAQKAAGLQEGQEVPEFQKTELQDAERELMLSAREPQVTTPRTLHARYHLLTHAQAYAPMLDILPLRR